jgi:hypothetical protein
MEFGYDPVVPAAAMQIGQSTLPTELNLAS